MLTVNELFHSIQGESSYAGLPCTFVRLAACDLRCSWCDTAYAFHEGRKTTVDEVVAEVDRLGCRLVEVTGGEPLLQPDAIVLLERLVKAGRIVLLETGGHRSLATVPPGVITIMDVKCPGSGECDRTDWTNIALLRPHDEVKFVIRDRGDYDYAREVLERHTLADRVAGVLFSPVHGVLDPKALAEWVLADRLPVRVQLQVHKFIWGADARGV
ncbi:MAG TPA: radical SAM protein [Vicinamibacterales bacterium]|jgi:7-carboxy-7-deazaguanine synthase